MGYSQRPITPRMREALLAACADPCGEVRVNAGTERALWLRGLAEYRRNAVGTRYCYYITDAGRKAVS